MTTRFNFNPDPWDVARAHYEREMRLFMARMLRHFNVTQIELPLYEVNASDTVEWQDLPNGNRLYRIKGHLLIDAAGGKE